MDKVVIPAEKWVGLYAELASYIEEYSSLDNHFDDDGNRKPEYEDQFHDITDNVENIMSQFLIKGEL